MSEITPLTTDNVTPAQTKVYQKIAKIESKVKTPPVRVIVFKGPYHEEVDAQIRDDHFLVFKTSDKTEHKKMIASEPAIFKSKRMGKKFILVWYCGYFDDITKDPDQLKYDIPAIEGILKLTYAITDTHLSKKLAEEIETKKMLREYIPWFIVLITNLIWVGFTYLHIDKIIGYK